MRHWAIPFLFLIGVCALTIRMLLDSQFGHGTLLYLLVPFVISIAIYLFTRRSERRGLGWALLNHLRFATIMSDLGIPPRAAHDAINDAVMAGLAFVKLRGLLATKPGL